MRPSWWARSDKSIFSRISSSMLAIFPITEMGLPASSSTKWEVMRIHFLSLSGFASSRHSTSVTAFDGEVNASSSSCGKPSGKVGSGA